MMPSAMLLVLLASSPPLEVVAPPTPLPAIIWVKADGPREVVRVALLDFVVRRPHPEPKTLHGTLYNSGRATPVELHLKWQETGDRLPSSWTGADYWLDVPQGATGDAVLSLDQSKAGWSFRLGEM